MVLRKKTINLSLRNHVRNQKSEVIKRFYLALEDWYPSVAFLLKPNYEVSKLVTTKVLMRENYYFVAFHKMELDVCCVLNGATISL